MPVEELAEVGLAQPPVDAPADLDADRLRDHRRAPQAPGQMDLAEAALAQEPFDPVREQRLRALDRLPGRQQAARRVGPDARRFTATGRGGGETLHGSLDLVAGHDAPARVAQGGEQAKFYSR